MANVSGIWRRMDGWMGAVNDDSTSGSANNYFFGQPKTSTRYNDTSASLVTQAFSDFQMTLDMKTILQINYNASVLQVEHCTFFLYFSLFSWITIIYITAIVARRKRR